MQQMKETKPIPPWLDEETQSLVQDIIDVLSELHPDLLMVILYGSVARQEELPLDDPDTSDVDLLAILDSDDHHVALRQVHALFHSPGLAYNRHLHAPREVMVMFASRTMQEWNPTFIDNVARDGMVLFKRGPLPLPFAA